MRSTTDCVKVYARKMGISMKDAKSQFMQALDVIAESITEEGGVNFSGIFSIKVNVRKERDFKNPMTGEQVHTPAKRVLKIKAFKDLDEKLNK